MMSGQAAILCDVFENYDFKIIATSSRDQWVKSLAFGD